MTQGTTTISDCPDADLPLTGDERLAVDQGDKTVDVRVSEIALLANPAIQTAVAAHAAAADPHHNYLTPTEANAAYAPAAQGVTNGNSHDHNGGDGGTIAYSSLSGLPTLGTAAGLDRRLCCR